MQFSGEGPVTYQCVNQNIYTNIDKFRNLVYYEFVFVSYFLFHHVYFPFSRYLLLIYFSPRWQIALCGFPSKINIPRENYHKYWAKRNCTIDNKGELLLVFSSKTQNKFVSSIIIIIIILSFGNVCLRLRRFSSFFFLLTQKKVCMILRWLSGGTWFYYFAS